MIVHQILILSYDDDTKLASVQRSERMTLFNDHYDLMPVADQLVVDEVLDVLDATTQRMVNRCRWWQRLPRAIGSSR